MVHYDPTAAPTANTTHLPAVIRPTAVEQHHHDQPVVYVPHAVDPDLMIPVRREHLPATPTAPTPHHPAPRPAIDPAAQRLVGVGVAAAGIGIGGSFFFGALAAATPALALIVAGLLLTKLGGRNSGSTHTHHETHIKVTNVARWWGHNTTRL
ncbi:hypothetical protein F0L17_14575 [Streptomyces sp. TRM43335]|uniref:Uncharacterized protein n=1 Tax=Streptomyces taklimakanensis TaxID=2569853 RepID=A0A6G2BDI9_9ACTN|nr:hypothetical protein [Streptomyces taklimakanensis]MTE20310.1 hypothetical protein [Streptomyces taklimakanensis]